MTNDSKLGMLAGVVGVIVAAVLFTKQPAQPTGAEPLAIQAVPTAIAPSGPPEAGPVAMSSTPVVRTRKDVDAKPTSRRSTYDDEP